MRLLVGHDGHEGGRDALELARILAGSALEASALVVTVLDDGQEAQPEEAPELTAEDAGEEVGAWLAEARDVLSEFPCETRIHAGASPAGVLTAIAEREPFDVVVVGSSHRGAVGRVFLGSVGRNLLNGSPVDVAIAPKGYADARHERLAEITVGYSGSPESKLALRRAEDLARVSQATLRLITVVGMPTAVPMPVPGSHPEPLQRPSIPDKIMREGIESVGPAVTAVSDRRDGEPAFELLKACRDRTDLLVLGSRGYGPLARVLLGSVSHKISVDATFPVLVARRPR